MWVIGGPGSGKSHLSTLAIEYLPRLYDVDHAEAIDVSVAYFYIREYKQQLRDSNTILKTLAWQVAEEDQVFRRMQPSLLSADGDSASIQVAVIGRITVKGHMEFEREEEFMVVFRKKSQEDLDRYKEDRLTATSIIKRLVELDKAGAKKPS
ncbi:MAG: hypothetical protein Q9192_007389 [Flavoplaca navasiana]